MDRFFKGFEEPGFPVHQGIFPVIGGCEYEKILVVPEGRLNRELLSDGDDVLEFGVGDDDRVGADDGDFVESVDQAVDFG